MENPAIMLICIVLLLAGLVVALVTGVLSVLHDLAEHSAQDGPTMQLDLNLSGNLDHIFSRQIESIDHFDRIAIKKREQRRAPAS